MAKRIATYNSNKGYSIFVRDNGTCNLVGRSGRSLSWEYVSQDPEILRTVAALGCDTASGLAVLNGGTFPGNTWSVDA